jgi:hypothetical protein
MHEIMDKKFYLGPKFGTLFNKKWITISELLQVCNVRIIDHGLPSIHFNTGAYPMEYTSPANPGRLPLPSIVPVPRWEKPKCLLAR